MIQPRPPLARLVPSAIAWIAAGSLWMAPAPGGARGEEPAAPPASGEEASAGEKGLMFVSMASGPKVYSPVDGGKQTVLAPARDGKLGVRLYSMEEWKATGHDWNAFLASAREKADALAESLEPQFRRDARGVLDYAVIDHPSPWLSSVLLSRRFLPRFSRELGNRLHVIVLGRHRLYIFPADGGKLESYAPALADLYHDDSALRHPVSLEVFLLDEAGFKIIGAIGD